MTMQGWGVKTIAGLGMLAGWFLACAGEDTPPVDDDLRGALVEGFGGADTQMGSAGTAGSGNGGRGGSGSGSAGRGGSGSSGSANAGSANAGSGNSGAAGSGEPVGGGGGGCDAFPILLEKCGSAGCHNAGSPQGEFAASEDGVLEFVDRPSTKGASCDGVFIDSANPEESLIYTRLSDPGCGFLTMPLTGDPLDDTQTECLLSWLEGFAE